MDPREQLWAEAMRAERQGDAAAVRTAIVNRTFDADHRDICRRRCSFRMAA
jgi:hypothetical protein